MNSIVHNEDCLEGMKQYPDKHFELAIVDPPYGINAAKKHTGPGWVERETKEWDASIPPPEYFTELFRVSKNQIVWGGNYMTEFLAPSMGWIFWDKGQRDFSLADGELAWSSFQKALRVFEMGRGSALAEHNNNGGRFHPTQKPIKLYKWLLKNYAKPGDKILDTHLGSGSSRIAAYEMGFDFTGYELDKDYFLAQEKRFQQHISQLKLFNA